MGNMGAMAGLWRKIQNEMRDAVSEAESKTLETAITELNASYAGAQPEIYKRTDQMRNSPKSTGVTGGGDVVSTTVYLDEGYTYNTGTYSTHKVFFEAENGGSGIVMTPGFWQRTEIKARSYAKSAFAKRCK